jgi:hypothetical protein
VPKRPKGIFSCMAVSSRGLVSYGALSDLSDLFDLLAHFALSALSALLALLALSPQPSGACSSSCTRLASAGQSAFPPSSPFASAKTPNTCLTAAHVLAASPRPVRNLQSAVCGLQQQGVFSGAPLEGRDAGREGRRGARREAHSAFLCVCHSGAAAAGLSHCSCCNWYGARMSKRRYSSSYFSNRSNLFCSFFYFLTLDFASINIIQHHQHRQHHSLSLSLFFSFPSALPCLTSDAEPRLELQYLRPQVPQSF